MHRCIEKYEEFWLNKKIIFGLVLMFVNFMAGAQFGYGMGLTGAALPSLIADDMNREFLFNGTTAAFLQSFFPGAYVFGNTLGPLAAPLSVFFLGFKITLFIYSVFALLGQIFSGLSAHYAMLVAGRLATGIASGVISSAGIEYANSLAPRKFKGAVGAMYLVGLTTAVLIANTTTLFSLIVHNWRWMTFVGIFPPIVLIVLSIIIPESPVWRQERKDRRTKSQNTQEKKFHFLEILKKLLTFKNAWRVFLCFVLVISIHLGGLVPMIVFLPITLEQAGLKNFYWLVVASVGVSFWNIVSSLVPVFFVDFIGRKILLTLGYIIMFGTTLSLGFVVYFLPPETSGIVSIVLILLFMIGNNGGINSIIFFLFNELFDAEITFITSAWNLTMFNFVSFLVGFSYFTIQSYVGLPGMLWIFSFVTLSCGTFLFVFLPETKLNSKTHTDETQSIEEPKEIEEHETSVSDRVEDTEMKNVEEFTDEKQLDVKNTIENSESTDGIEDIRKHEMGLNVEMNRAIEELNMGNTEIFDNENLK